MNTTHTIEEIAIRDLVEFSDNPRTISDEARERLRRSLARFGLYRPLVVWRDGRGRSVVVAGNQRLALLRETLGRTATVPCVVLDVDERTARLIAIRDNNEEGEWSWEALGAYLSGLSSLAEEPVDWNLTGFDTDTIASLLTLSEQGYAETVSAVVEASPRPVPVEQVDEDEVEVEDAPVPEYPERRFTRVSIGSLRGQVSHETYARFLRVWTTYSERCGSTDVSLVVASIARTLLRARGATPR